MSVHDDFLTIPVRETIFLSSDKAGIEEIQELELIPVVDVIESSREVSITGYLELQGKYVAKHEAKKEAQSGTDSLVSAMQFTPFDMAAGKSSEDSLYPMESLLTHRIPLNISIPVERIADVTEIYGVVDGFDYEIKSERQLHVQAELKLSGIQLKMEAADEQEEPVAEDTKVTNEEAWEFVHVAHEDEQTEYQQASIEELEQKLSALEKQVEEYEQEQVQDHRYSHFQSETHYQTPAQPSQPFYPSYPSYASTQPVPPNPFENMPNFTYPHHVQAFGEVSYQQENQPLVSDPAFEPSYAKEDAKEEPAYKLASAEENNYRQEAEEVVADYQVAPEAEVTTTIAEQSEQANVIDFQAALEAEHPQAEETAEEAEEIEEAEAEVNVPVIASPPAEPKEMMIAISSKGAKEPQSSLNITSILTASRPKVAERESGETSRSMMEYESASLSSSYSRESSAPSLTSFVRDDTEKFSKVKMCIIQRDETLEQIAQRYELPMSRIKEANRLSTEMIFEGQVLYIPL